MAKSFRAVYKDTEGRTYSCPVEIHEGQWMLVVASGFAPITHILDNEEYGEVIFHSYREEPEPEDLRLYLPERIGTESSFQQLQRAYAEKEIVAQRKHREAARVQAQETFTNPAKVEAARHINNEFAALRNRHGIKNQ
jgi:hypothetical protein